MAFTLINESMNFMPTGTLSSAYPKETDAVDNSDTLLITNPVDMDVIQDTLTYQLEKNIAIIGTGSTVGFPTTQDHEYIAFKTIVSTGDNYRINGITRGAIETPPMDHAAASRIWFMTYGGGVLDKPLVNPSTQNIKLTPHTARGTLGVSDAQALTVKMPRFARVRCPYPPAKIRIQDGAGTPQEWSTGPVNADNDLVLHWVHRNRLYQEQLLNQDDISVKEGTEIGTTAGAGWSTQGYLFSAWTSTGGVYRARNVGRTSTSYSYTVAMAVADGAMGSTEIELRIQSKRQDETSPGEGAVVNCQSLPQRRVGIERVGWGIGWGRGWGGVPNT